MAHLRFYLPVSDCNVLRREHVAQRLLLWNLIPPDWQLELSFDKGKVFRVCRFTLQGILHDLKCRNCGA